MAEKKLSVDEVVIQQGDIGDFFYVVEQGSLDVFVSRDGASAVKVHTYGPGGKKTGIFIIFRNHSLISSNYIIFCNSITH